MTQTNKETTALTAGLTSQEISLRKEWLKFNENDETVLKEEVDHIMSKHADVLMDNMYEHFLSFDETRSFFPNSQIIDRAKSAQRDYFLRLTKGSYDEDYVRDRLRVGSTHHRIELDPKWYIGAYNCALSFLLPLLNEHCQKDSDKLINAISALLKIIFFDMGMAIESYISAKESSIRQHRDSIRELETERRTMKSVLEGAPIGIVSLSENFVCLECNDEFTSILDVASRNDVIGKSLFELTPNINRTVFDEVRQTGIPYRKSADLQNLSKVVNVHAYWDWAIWPVKDGNNKLNGFVAMFANVTDGVHLQQQREDFVATLTHDLKTPILATNRAVGYLLEGDFGELSSPQKEILETVLQSNTALYGLVQTLLDVYRFDSGIKELQLKVCNIASIIAQLLTEIMPLAQEKGVELQANLPESTREINCDEYEIKRVVQNLIDNSLKFTPTGGFITVTLEQNDNKTLVSISDTGRGVPEENKSKLFQRFWKAGSTGRHYASTGLGLYLCRRIIEEHGGKIWFDSTIGKGSTFYFEI